MALAVVRSTGIIRKVHRYHVRLGNTDMISRVLIHAEKVTAGDSSDSATNALPFFLNTAALLIIGYLQIASHRLFRINADLCAILTESQHDHSPSCFAAAWTIPPSETRASGTGCMKARDLLSL
jgi:hypothetical protein